MQYQNNYRMSSPPSFIPAKCDNCGGDLEVNPNLEKAFCPYCGTPYIVANAIQKYNYTFNTNKNYYTNNFHTVQHTVNYEKKGIFQSYYEYKTRKEEIDYLREQERKRIEKIACLIFLFFVTGFIVFIVLFELYA